MVILVT